MKYKLRNLLIVIIAILIAVIIGLTLVLYQIHGDTEIESNSKSNPALSNEYPSIATIPSPGDLAVRLTPSPTLKPRIQPSSKVIVTPTISEPPKDVLITTMQCDDCTLAPVDKSHKLALTYAPKTIQTTLSGGGYLIPEARDHLSMLFNAASVENINITIISSYRSYVTQQQTFNYWVGTEIAKGYSKNEAQIRANNYSAKPGHSEHQLGTVVDLRCSRCNSFDNSPGNIALYNFLKVHAHEFGFVISYPTGKEYLTGYVAENWHIRYIGVSLATELRNRNYLSTTNQEFSTKFLREKLLY